MCPATRLGPFVDDTLLAPEATPADIEALSDRGNSHGVAAVCVNPAWVDRCVEPAFGSGVAVAAVTGFPFGERACHKGGRGSGMIIESGRELAAQHAGSPATRELDQ
jgi:deoxyribose-phosphate aldolase